MHTTTQKNKPSLLERSPVGYDLKDLFNSFSTTSKAMPVIDKEEEPKGWTFKEVKSMTPDFKEFVFKNNITKPKYLEAIELSMTYDKHDSLWITFLEDQEDRYLVFEESKFFEYIQWSIKDQLGWDEATVKGVLEINGWEMWAKDYLSSSVGEGEWIKTV
jgi:hypothetical protein